MKNFFVRKLIELYGGIKMLAGTVIGFLALVGFFYAASNPSDKEINEMCNKAVRNLRH